MEFRSNSPVASVRAVRRKATGTRRFHSLLCLLLLTVAACGRSLPIAPEVALATGTWAGVHEVLSCEGGVDFRACGRFPRTGSLRLTLSQSADEVSGVVTIEVPSPSSSNIASFTTAAIPLTGKLSSARELRLSGATILRATSFGNESARVAEWTSVLGSDGLTGRIVLITTGFYPGSGVPQTFQVTSDLRDVKRDAVP
jgi:hypothetical protein